MKVLYERHFSKDLDRIEHEKGIKTRLLRLIEEIKRAKTLSDISRIKKIEGYKTYYRIRIGDFRLGIKVTEEKVILVRFLHRKEIYRKFP